ncbi:hypothetical protein [Streptococcus pneumoniae]|uniref:hypothetical protein n=1 Tax=Streptococcus pneumoniae TaxID=1313 RepID=UPI0009FFA7C9|nr:hypothetical protein [Streptococcus pneumoniae]
MNQESSSILIGLLDEINNLKQNKKIWMIKENPALYFSIIKDLYNEKFSEIDNSLVQNFFTFLSHGKLPSDSDYKNLRDQLIIPIFDIKTSKLSDSSEVRDAILNKITHQIFSLNLSDENCTLTNFLIYRLLDAKVACKYFYGPSNNYYTDQYRENLRFIDNIQINKLNEINLDDRNFSSEVLEEIVYKPDSDLINYQNMLYTDENSAKLLTYDSFLESRIIDNDDNVTNLEVIKNNETDYIVTFDFNDYQGQYLATSDFFFSVDITHYVDTEIWETYIADSFRNYQNSNYKLAFLLGFIAIESFIENIIYTIKTKFLKKIVRELYYEQYGVDVFTIKELQYFLSDSPNEEFQKETNQLKYERKGLDNILWYVNLYRNFSNDQRNLTKDKLKDIIKLISQLSHINSNPTDLTIIDFGQVFGNQSSIENVILNTLTKYSETRNKIAHGSELSEEERDFRHLYSNLIIVFVAFIEYLNGKILY